MAERTALCSGGGRSLGRRGRRVTDQLILERLVIVILVVTVTGFISISLPAQYTPLISFDANTLVPQDAARTEEG